MTAATGAPVAHSFRRPELLQQALTHRSFSATNYERLEFIGDAVLDCVVSAVLYDRFPKLPEGDLSRMRASLVNEPALVRVARRIDLGPHLRVGEGERRSGSADKPSILADALEAVFGAVFVDAGFEAAREVILDAYGDILDDASPTVCWSCGERRRERPWGNAVLSTRNTQASLFTGGNRGNRGGDVLCDLCGLL